MSNPWEIYDLLIARAESKAAYTNVKHITLGLTWTSCHSYSAQGETIGLAMSPGRYTRTLPWSGTLIDRPTKDLIGWIKSWNPFEAVIGLAAINSVLNTAESSLMANALPVISSDAPNLAVFEHFLPRLQNKKVVVVGRYPGLERYSKQLNLTILERNPIDGDYPDNACEYVLPAADWVFITASSLANKTFPRLSELSRNAMTVLMGPSLPWLEDWAEFGVDFLAGVRVNDLDQLQSIVAEGGGVRIFDHAVQYCVLDLGLNKMAGLKKTIADLFTKRERLKCEMDDWYKQAPTNTQKRFPNWELLEKIDQEISLADLRYKRQWDARQ